MVCDCWSAATVPTNSGENIIHPSEKVYFEVKHMPVIQVSVWEGQTLENKKRIVEGITKIFTDIGIPKDAVTIVIYEEPKNNWATGGQLHSEKHANR